MGKEQPETALCRQIKSYLDAVLADNVYYFHTPNEGKRSKIMGAILKAIGMKPGVFDYCIFWNGGIRFYEAKAPDKKPQLSPKQKEFSQDLDSMNIPWAYGNTMESVRQFLIDSQVPLDQYQLEVYQVRSIDLDLSIRYPCR